MFLCVKKLAKKGEEMKKTITSGIVLTFLITGTTASSTTLSFDNVIGQQLDTPWEQKIPSGYGGLSWNNAGRINPEMAGYNSLWSGYAGLQNNSDDWVAFNRNANPITISSNNSWTWQGFTATSAWTDSADLSIHGSLGGSTIFDFTAPVTLLNPLFISGINEKIDTLTVSVVNYSPDSYGWFGMDDLKFEQTNPVPEPGTILLFSAGLITLITTKNKKRKKE